MALKINHLVEIDLKRTDVTPVLRMKQGDTASREVTIALFCDGAPWAVPSEVTVAKLAFCKPDRIGGEYYTIDGANAFAFNSARTEVTMQIHSQVLTVAGNVVCELRLIGSSGAVLCAFNFIIYAEKSPLGMLLESHGLYDDGNGLTASDVVFLNDGGFSGPKITVAQALKELLDAVISDGNGLTASDVVFVNDGGFSAPEITVAQALKELLDAVISKVAAPTQLTYDATAYQSFISFIRTINEPGHYTFKSENVFFAYEFVKAETQDGVMFYGILKRYSGDENLIETEIYAGGSAATIALMQ